MRRSATRRHAQALPPVLPLRPRRSALRGRARGTHPCLGEPLSRHPGGSPARGWGRPTSADRGPWSSQPKWVVSRRRRGDAKRKGGRHCLTWSSTVATATGPERCLERSKDHTRRVRTERCSGTRRSTSPKGRCDVPCAEEQAELSRRLTRPDRSLASAPVAVVRDSSRWRATSGSPRSVRPARAPVGSEGTSSSLVRASWGGLFRRQPVPPCLLFRQGPR